MFAVVHALNRDPNGQNKLAQVPNPHSQPRNLDLAMPIVMTSSRISRTLLSPSHTHLRGTHTYAYTLPPRTHPFICTTHNAQTARVGFCTHKWGTRSVVVFNAWWLDHWLGRRGLGRGGLGEGAWGVPAPYICEPLVVNAASRPIALPGQLGSTAGQLGSAAQLGSTGLLLTWGPLRRPDPPVASWPTVRWTPEAASPSSPSRVQ